MSKKNWGLWLLAAGVLGYIVYKKYTEVQTFGTPPLGTKIVGGKSVAPSPISLPYVETPLSINVPAGFSMTGIE